MGQGDDDDRDGGDARARCRAEVPGHEQPGEHRGRAEDRAEHHRRQEPAGPGPCRGGRRQEQPDDQQRADGPVGRDHGEGHQGDQDDLGQTGPEAERRGLARVERRRGEGAVEHGRDEQRHGGGDRERAEVGPGDGEHVPEQDRRHVGGERPRAGDDDHPEREHPDEEQPDRGVVRQTAPPPEEPDAEHHRTGTDRGAEHGGHPGHRGEGDTGEHAVRQRLAEERHPAHEHPGADDGTEDRREHAGRQGSEHEVDGERVGQPGHGPERYMKMVPVTVNLHRCRPSPSASVP